MKRAERRHHLLLIKKKILARPYSRLARRLKNNGYWSVSWSRPTVVQWRVLNSEQRQNLMRIVFRGDGRARPEVRGCGASCAICNPHLFLYIKHRKRKRDEEILDSQEFEECMRVSMV